MGRNTRNIERLGREGLTIKLPVDEQGYAGRECPVPECLGHFKLVFGTGLPDTTHCICPYCGHRGDQKTFWTNEQNEYARSIVLREMTRAVHAGLKGLEFETKPKGAYGIGFSLKLKPSALPSVHSYRERELETHVDCESCTLRYAVYGVFAWCPDCGSHNSRQILDRNLALVGKILDLALTQETELQLALAPRALEGVVAAFDGYGRAAVEAHMAAATPGAFAQSTSFQNIEAARDRVRAGYNHDLAACMAPTEWDLVTRIFQQRHVLAHRMGVADADYLRKSGDTVAPGRLVRIEVEEIRAAIALLLKTATGLSAALSASAPRKVP